MDHQCKLKTAMAKSVLKGIFKDNIALLFRCLLGCFVTGPCRRVLGTERQKFRMSPLGTALTEGQDPSGSSLTVLLGDCLPSPPNPFLPSSPASARTSGDLEYGAHNFPMGSSSWGPTVWCEDRPRTGHCHVSPSAAGIRAHRQRGNKREKQKHLNDFLVLEGAWCPPLPLKERSSLQHTMSKWEGKQKSGWKLRSQAICPPFPSPSHRGNGVSFKPVKPKKYFIFFLRIWTLRCYHLGYKNCYPGPHCIKDFNLRRCW